MTMNDAPPPRPPDPNAQPTRDPSWEVIHALAAGELAPDEARALRARAARDPALAARVAEAEALERALGAEPLLPVPFDLAQRVVAGLPARRGWATWPLPIRAAAALLLAFGSWVAATGTTPTLAAAQPSPALEAAFEPALEALDPFPIEIPDAPLAAEALGTGALWGQGLAGLLLLGGGLTLARRRYRLPSRSSPDEEVLP